MPLNGGPCPRWRRADLDDPSPERGWRGGSQRKRPTFQPQPNALSAICAKDRLRGESRSSGCVARYQWLAPCGRMRLTSRRPPSRAITLPKPQVAMPSCPPRSPAAKRRQRQTVSTTLPLAVPPSTASCALTASIKGKRCAIWGEMMPRPTASSTSPARALYSSRSVI